MSSMAGRIPPGTSISRPDRDGRKRGRLQRTLRIAALAAGVALLGGVGGVAAWIASLGPMPLGEELEFSTQVIDREGRLLRPYATADGRWRLPTDAASVDPRYLDALILYEDRRFRSHHGVDPVAMGLANNGGVIEILSSPRGATWTIILTMPNGVTCMIAAGENWEFLHVTRGEKS